MLQQGKHSLMKYLYLKNIIILFLILSAGCTNAIQEVSNTKELQAALNSKGYSKIIYLSSGDYILQPIAIIDSTCANCQDPSEQLPATAGLVITGRQVHLIGPDDHSARINTNAGYGLYFLNCSEGVAKNLTISGGTRNADSRASDAAIVVKNSSVLIENNLIRDNIGDSTLLAQNVVGIMGICGRENSHLTIKSNRIIRNSWDGIALFRKANAVITDNLIDGVDKATSKIAGGGRGVAIGVTWDAKAVIRGNLVKNYWKGIGIFVDGNAVVENNIVEDLLTWGIAFWDAGIGQPAARITKNIVYNTGACGVNLSVKKSNEPENSFVQNIIVKTAQNEKYDSPDYYGYQCALSIFNTPHPFQLADNIFYDNRTVQDSLPDYDLEKKEYDEKLEAVLNNIENNYLTQSSFFRDNVK